jgi:hypothetical protein
LKDSGGASRFSFPRIVAERGGVLSSAAELCFQSIAKSYNSSFQGGLWFFGEAKEEAGRGPILDSSEKKSRFPGPA